MITVVTCGLRIYELHWQLGITNMELVLQIYKVPNWIAQSASDILS